jgi:regulator of protease activity HflC (stomatin/prohibitin superfamily)
MRLFWISLALLVLGGFLVGASCRRIAPDQIGLRTMNVGESKGLVQRDFDPGFYRSLWLVESWDTLPRSVQRVTFTNRVDLRGPDDAPAIEAKTIDGYSVTVEATVLFRIAQGKGHVVYRDSGPGDEFKRRARELAAPEIAQAFATLRTEAIFDREKRRAPFEQMESGLRERLLNLKSFELVNLAITYVAFDPKYEEELEKKKVANQKKLLATSQQRLAEEQGIKDKIVQETDNKVKQIQNELANQQREIKAANDNEKAKVIADATLKAFAIRAAANEHELKAQAEGSKLVKEAEAYSLDLERKALGDRAANWIAYKAAQSFPVKSVTMSSLGIDWFDPVSLAQKVGAILQATSGGVVPPVSQNP